VQHHPCSVHHLGYTRVGTGLGTTYLGWEEAHIAGGYSSHHTREASIPTRIPLPRFSQRWPIVRASFSHNLPKMADSTRLMVSLLSQRWPIVRASWSLSLTPGYTTLRYTPMVHHPEVHPPWYTPMYTTLGTPLGIPPGIPP